MYVYIVHAPDSPNFKFGLSSRPNGNRLESYQTAYGAFDATVVACNNAQEIEQALKTRFESIRLPHYTGSLSELVPRGDDDCNLVEAVRIVYNTRTLSRHARYVEPVIGDEAEAARLREQYAADHMDAVGMDDGEEEHEEEEEDTVLKSLLEKANASPSSIRLADVAAHALKGTIEYCSNDQTWLGQHGELDDSAMHLAVVRAIVEAAEAHKCDTRRLLTATGKRKNVNDCIDLLKLMYWRRKLEVNDNPLAEWLEANLEVTRDPAHVALQSELLERIKAPGSGWAGAGRHKVRKLKELIKNWCSSKQIAYGASNYRDEAGWAYGVLAKGVKIIF
jgi:hypothetical protein